MISVLDAITPGASHIERNIECQDYKKYLRINLADREIIIAAVADGVGSCKNSSQGSKTATEAAVNYTADKLRELMYNGWDQTICIRVINAAFSSAYYAMDALANQENISLFSISTTLTLAVYDGEHLAFGHAGDSGLIVLYEDGSYEMITERKKGDTANSVIPLNGDYTMWQFDFAKKKVVSFVLMTDGLLDYGVKDKKYNNMVYFPLYGSFMLLPIASDKEEKNASERVLEWISSPELQNRVKDDISFIIVSNQALIEMVSSLIKWDEEKWLEANKIEEKTGRELYDEYEKAKKDGTLVTPPYLADDSNNPSSAYPKQNINPVVQNQSLHSDGVHAPTSAQTEAFIDNEFERDWNNQSASSSYMNAAKKKSEENATPYISHETKGQIEVEDNEISMSEDSSCDILRGSGNDWKRIHK